MARQQGHLATDDAEFWAIGPASTSRIRGRISDLAPKTTGCLLQRAAKIDIDLSAPRIVDDQDEARISRIGNVNGCQNMIQVIDS